MCVEKLLLPGFLFEPLLTSPLHLVRRDIFGMGGKVLLISEIFETPEILIG
jgi:hypothetical protein